MAIRQVPALSLKDFIHGDRSKKLLFQEQLFLGLKEYGFVILRDHGIPNSLFEKSYSLLERLFALSPSVKESYILKNGAGQRGYTAFGKEHAKDSPVMDLKEFWHVGRELAPSHPQFRHEPPNLWPSEVPEFKENFLFLYSELENAGRWMLRALEEPLKVQAGYFDSLVENGSSILRLLHYPPIPEGVDPRCVRAAAHEDINFITLLPTATASGLQLKDRNGEWLDVDDLPGSLIVDSGDMLARLTNEVIPSTTHRVINTEEGKRKSRYSMPFFLHPRPEASLATLESCLKDSPKKFPDISAGEFLNQRLREIGLIK